MGTSEWIFSFAALVIGGGVVVALLWAAAGRRPDGSTETVLQVDAENRSVFDKHPHADWDGEVRITRPTDPHIIKQVQRVNTPEDET